jgi:hypothetical protein
MIASFTASVFFYGTLTTNEYTSYAKSSLDYSASKPHNTTLDLSYLSENHISDTFTYARRLIRVKNFDGERPILTIVNETLFPDPLLIQKANLSIQEVTDLPPLTLHVPSTVEVDTSVMSFGIATDIRRLNASIPQLSHWLSNTGCRVQVVAPPTDSTLDVESFIQYQPTNINFTVTISELPFPKAYFSLVKHLYESRTPQTQWLVLIDDDTFVTSLPFLVSHLSQTYDATKPQLIAATSDDLDQIRAFGLLPFGGGGIFMSLPLAEILASSEVYDKCMDSPQNHGDQLFNDCLNQYTDVKPFFDHGLNQMDITGSPDGYFESGRRMLTVHHWKSWFHVNVPMASKVSEVCGEEGVFMRWGFQDDVVLSNGFSIVEYGDGIAEVELEKVEKTWIGKEDRFLHHIGPMRGALEGEKKRSFRLVEAEVLEEGVRQVYLHRATDAENGVNGLLELLWLF